MRKLWAFAVGLLLTSQAAWGDIYQARYGVSETFDFWMYAADGTLKVDEADAGTETTVACNEGAETTATNDFTDEGTFYSIVLTAAEMQCERIVVVIAGTTTGGFIIQTSANASAMTPTNEANIASVTDGALVAADFGADFITAAKLAADVTTELQAGLATSSAQTTISTNVSTLLEALTVLGAEQTADSGTTTTAVDAALTQATNDWFKGTGIHFTSGTLLGQDACVTGFTAASDTLTFAPAVTTAVTTHTYYLLPNAECVAGDTYTRIGAPAGASLAADVQAVEDETDDIGVAGAGLTAADDAVIALVDDIGVAGAGLTAIPDVDTLLEALVGLGAEFTADSGTTTTIVDAALTQATNDWFLGQGVYFTSSTLAGQSACITGFTAASDTLTITTVTATVGTQTYYILPMAKCQTGDSFARIGAAGAGLTNIDLPNQTMDVTGTLSTVTAVTNTVTANMAQISGDSTAADNLEAFLDLILANTNGALPPYGISFSGTAQAYTAGTPSITLAAATAAADDDFNGHTVLIWGDEDDVQTACVADYTGATDIATLDAALGTAPTGTILYVGFATNTCEASGSSLTAADVWAAATRTLTALDEDTTTIDLNNTTVGSLTTLDEDTTTLDLNATTIGTVTTAANVTTVNGLAANVLTAASAAADLTTELQAGLATAAALTTVDDYVDTEVATLLEALVILGGEQTADSGTTTTLVDAALTQATNNWFDGGVMVAFSSGTLLGQTACVRGFTAASDTLSFTPAVTTAVTTHNYYLLPSGACALAENDGGDIRFDAEALEQAPTGSGASASVIADTVWEELLADHSGVAGSTAAALSAAQTGGGLDAAGVRSALGMGSANLDTQLGDLPTNAELATSQAAADDATLAAIAALNNLSSAQAQTAAAAALDAENGANFTSADDAVIAAIAALNNLSSAQAQTAAAAALNAEDGANFTAADDAVIAAVDAVPTNAELTTALATADDAVLAAIAALNNLSAAQVRDLTIEDQGSGVSLGCAIAVVLAYASGDLATTGQTSTYKDASGTETRAAGTVSSAGNRAATITCPSY